MSYNDPDVKINVKLMSDDLGPTSHPNHAGEGWTDEELAQFARERVETEVLRDERRVRYAAEHRAFLTLLVSLAMDFDRLMVSECPYDMATGRMRRATMALMTSREYLR